MLAHAFRELLRARWLSGRVLDSRPRGGGGRVQASLGSLHCGP